MSVDVAEQKEYYIERLNKANLDDLGKLHNAVYRKPHPEGFFAKKYDTAYTGLECIGYIAYNTHHQPIACYAVIPCFIRYNDELILAAQSADNLTHSKYRYKGLFVKLAHMTFDLCREEGIGVIFGFPDQNTLHSFMVKLRWQMTETMDRFIIPVGIIPVDWVAKQLPVTKKLYKAYQDLVLKKYLTPQQGIDNSVFRDGFGGINRNAHYLKHKTYHDTQVIKIGNAVLWIKIKNGLMIGDISCEEEDFDMMINELRQVAFRLGLKNIQFHTSHQTTLSKLLGEKYYAEPSYYVLFKDMGANIELDKIKFTFADLESF